MMVRIGIIGMGWMGQNHAELSKFIEGCKLIAVCDKNKEVVEKVKSLYQIEGYTDYHQLLAREDIDAVYVVTPVTTHCQIVKDCVEARKHILCEKPMALSLEEVNLMRDMINNSDKKFMICFPERYVLSSQEAKSIINQKLIGHVDYIRCNYRFSMKKPGLHAKWIFDREQGGGLILEASVHLWDMIRWLTGKEIKDVIGIAHENIVNNSPLEDNFAAIAHMDNGGIACIDMSISLPKDSPTDKRFEIIGTEGSIYINEFNNYITVNSEKGIEVSPGKNIKGLTYPDVMWHSHIEGGIKRLQQEFIRCIREDIKPKPGVEDGARACEITWAIMNSLKSKKLEQVYPDSA